MYVHMYGTSFFIPYCKSAFCVDLYLLTHEGIHTYSILTIYIFYSERNNNKKIKTIIEEKRKREEEKKRK